MKFRATVTFRNEFERLNKDHRRKFISLMPEFNDSCELYAESKGDFVWPARLRVSRLTSHKEIWEMTWSFSGPDGRATFRFVAIDDVVGVEWRRIGRHEIYQNP